MKTDPQIFKDQPVIGEGEDAAIAEWVAHWGTVNAWLRTNPSLANLKKAALYEAENKCRAMILDRILSKIARMEKAIYLDKLLKLACITVALGLVLPACRATSGKAPLPPPDGPDTSQKWDPVHGYNFGN